MDKNIPDIEYVGYYWMSDRTDSDVIGDREYHQTEKMPDELKKCLSDPQINPFVIEAQLYNPTEKLSIGIKYVDGEYIISRCEAPKDIPSDSVTLKRYVANRMGKHRLLFRQYWEEKPDELCEGMDVLQPAAMAFVGFEKITEKEKTNDKGSI